MIAAFPMYDRPENRAAHDALWAGIRENLGYGPHGLSRNINYLESWAHPDLLIGQICNLPYRAKFRDQLTRIGCGDYGLSDTPPGYYHAVLITRTEDASRGLGPACLGTFAYNDVLSQSGWGAPLALIQKKGLAFRDTLETGSHLASLLAVADGRASLASIDAITWSMFQKWEPQSAGLSVIARTGLSPGMTFVTRNTNDPAPLFDAMQKAISDLPSEHAKTLGLRGLVALPDGAYNIPLPSETPR